MNDIIYNWLKGFPGLQLLQRQQVDAVPGGCGLFYRGARELERSRDLLGGMHRRKLLRFRIHRYGEPLESAVFFTMLASWVETSSPSLGFDAPAALKDARCVRDQGGLALWEADLEITCWEDL